MRLVPTPRVAFALLALYCASLLVIGWLLQHGELRQQPCPLCILQRYAFIVLGLVCIIAAAHGPGRTGTLAYLALADLIATAGASLAAWQLTRGHTMLSCTSDPIGIFVNSLPTVNWWPEYFFATGGCADRYDLFGVVIPVWSLAGFAVVLLALGFLLVRQLRQPPAA